MTARRNAGIAAAAVAVVGAAVASGVAVERRAVGRARSAPDPFAGEPLGQRHSAPRSVTADDGVHLAVEVDGDPDGTLTIVLIHGFTLSMDFWHFQRRDLADVGKLVLYDQRSHGSSGRSPREHATIDQLGHDLLAVLEAEAPTGPVVLIGHSMGGMTILALADQHPELFGDRVIGVALVNTAAGPFADTAFGVPGFLGKALRPVLPGAFRAANRRAALIERGRRAGGDLAFLATRWFSFGLDASPSLTEFVERMIAGTSIEVMTEFVDTFLTHDKLRALEVLRGVPTLVIGSTRDLITPARNSEAMAEALPDAELLMIDGAGHMAALDRHEEVTDALRRLVRRSLAADVATPASS